MKSISADIEYNSSDSDFSLFDSEASRINFWRDINTKDADYDTAVIVRQQGSYNDRDDTGNGADDKLFAAVGTAKPPSPDKGRETKMSDNISNSRATSP